MKGVDAPSLTTALKEEARRLGFALAGACPAAAPAGMPRFVEWLEAGYGGQMHYLAKRREAYAHPRSVLDGAQSVLMLAMNYGAGQPRRPHEGQGRVSRYAWGEVDYHDLIHDRLKRLAAFLQERSPGAKARGVVDTAPLLEREFAQLAGLGWVGKNTLLLNRSEGSWFFLAALVTDQTLVYDEPHETDHCGTCTACLDACPTDAFPQPYVLDATRCISYLTIELRDHIPRDLRPGMGEWVFGCDVCQDVCPWNRRAPATQEDDFEPRADLNPVELRALFDLDDDEFRARFRRTPLWRPKRRGLLRNAAIAMGNRPAAENVNPLRKGLQDAEPLIRAACAWALGRHDDARARDALRERKAIEEDSSVIAEIRDALKLESSL
ncbi:MAG: tRNA epoxyqueuosine(34) reductase QueG [Planctomycetes bacterium]|nr:tRNA epoxyqueuosine(34) reductase QueG [Planctomycetota bacterium]